MIVGRASTLCESSLWQSVLAHVRRLPDGLVDAASLVAWAATAPAPGPDSSTVDILSTSTTSQPATRHRPHGSFDDHSVAEAGVEELSKVVHTGECAVLSDEDTQCETLAVNDDAVDENGDRGASEDEPDLGLDTFQF